VVSAESKANEQDGLRVQQRTSASFANPGLLPLSTLAARLERLPTRVQLRAMLLRPLLASTLGTWLLLQCPIAHADPAAAEALFREGRSLLERGELTSACEKLEASNALEASAGTLLNLADCRLKQGRTATAWAHFLSAGRLAQNQGRPEQASEAKRRASELEPKLSTLTLVAPAAPAGLEVRRAGQPVLAASFGSPVPVDPGLVVIEASAPGHEAVRLEVTIGATADRRVLEIPKLQKIASAERASTESPAPVTENAASSQAEDDSVLPWAIGGVGAATLAAGGVLGALALSSDSKAVDACSKPNNQAECTNVQGRRDSQALAATVCVGVGAVGIGVAALWLLTRPSGRPQSAWSYHGEVTHSSALLQLKVRF
jgi:tetratricopeptide (TPR) repeat protein